MHQYVHHIWLYLLSVAHHHVGVDESEGVDDDFALHRLDGIDHDGNSPETRQKLTNANVNKLNKNK